MDDAIAGNMVERLGLADVFARCVPMTTPSSTSQSVFSELRGMTTSSFGPTMAEVAFMKMIGSGGTVRAGFGGMVGVVEADADELADAGDAGPEPRLTVHQRQAGGIERGQLLQRVWIKEPAGNVVDPARGVANAALAVDQTGLLPAYLSKSQKFHVEALLNNRTLICAGPAAMRAVLSASAH